MMRLLVLILILCLWSASHANERALSTLVLANADSRDSLALARHYAEKRGIPEKNIIALPLPNKETISWKTYVETLHNPLVDWLIDEGWLRAVGGGEVDFAGRTQTSILGHSIEFLVICKGVPLRIEADATLQTPERIQAFKRHLPPALNLSSEDPALFDKLLAGSMASVDSEVASIPFRMTENHVVGFIQNPLFRKNPPNPVELSHVIRTSRLDGPDFNAARRLVDSALEAEQKGLRGRAYVDIGGPHAQGDRWFETIRDAMMGTHFPTSVNEGKGTFAEGDRFDAPALYFGWYAGSVNGPFKEPGFRFPPGAVAVHLHSFSATTLSAREQGWVGPLVDRGVTATLGNVYEPTLILSHHLDVYALAILSGWTVGDAAWCAMPVLSWQGISVGDPLYRPLKVSMEEQMGQIGDSPNPYSQYVILREMGRRQRKGDLEGARSWGDAHFLDAPGLALALELARLDVQAGETQRAKDRLAFARRMRMAFADDRAVLIEISRLLGELSDEATALQILGNLKQLPISEGMKKQVADLGLKLALQSGNAGAIREWQPPVEAPESGSR